MFGAAQGVLGGTIWTTLFSFRLCDLCWALAKCVYVFVCARARVCLQTCKTAAELIPRFCS